jgi:putative FmdB family regulatory protein
MPTYSYRCEKCGKKFDRTETMSEHEAAKAKCAKCGSKNRGVCCTGPRLRGDYEEKLTNGNIIKGPRPDRGPSRSLRPGRLLRYALRNTGALRPRIGEEDVGSQAPGFNPPW